MLPPRTSALVTLPVPDAPQRSLASSLSSSSASFSYRMFIPSQDNSRNHPWSFASPLWDSSQHPSLCRPAPRSLGKMRTLNLISSPRTLSRRRTDSCTPLRSSRRKSSAQLFRNRVLKGNTPTFLSQIQKYPVPCTSRKGIRVPPLRLQDPPPFRKILSSQKYDPSLCGTLRPSLPCLPPLPLPFQNPSVTQKQVSLSLYPLSQRSLLLSSSRDVSSAPHMHRSSDHRLPVSKLYLTKCFHYPQGSWTGLSTLPMKNLPKN